MIVRRLGAVVIAALAFLPVTVTAASGPTPAQRREALADSVDGGYVDVAPGTPPVGGLRFAFGVATVVGVVVYVLVAQRRPPAVPVEAQSKT